MKLIKLNAIDSTNEYIKKNRDFLSEKALCVITFNQTEGKGQRGNTWVSEPGSNLCISLYFSDLNISFKDQFNLNMLVSLKIIDILNSLFLKNLKIKWPNGIMAENKKISGILIETFSKKNIIKDVIIGIGINVNQKSFIKLPSAGSMFLQTNKKYDLNKVFEELLDTLDLFFDLLKKPNKINLLSSFEKLLYKKGEWCQFKADGFKFFGRIIGVSDHGLLMIEKKSKKVIQYSNGGVEMIY